MTDQPAPGVTATESTPAPKTEALGNSPETRNPDGSIKDPAAKADPAADPAKAVELAKEPGKEGKEPAKAEGVPEKYSFQAPEGQKLDDKLIAEATPIFKELGLSNEAAQKLVDFYNKSTAEQASAGAKAVEDMRTAWRNDVFKTADLGNGTDGLKPEVSANIAKAFAAMDPKVATAMKSAFDLTGSGDNPDVIRGMNAIGKLLSEGSLVTGGGPSKLGQAAPGAAPKSAASALFPNLKSSSNP